MSDEPRPAAPPARGTRRWWSANIPVPTGRAAGLLAVAGLAVLAAPAPLPGVVVVGVVLLLVAVDGWRAPAPWRVGLARDLPAVVPLDATASVGWTLRNPVDRALRVALADELAPSLGASDRRVQITVPPTGRVHATASLTPTRRGTFRPTAVTMRVEGPWGLAVRQAERSLPGRLEVHPSFRSREAALLRLRRARILDQGLRSVRGRGGGTEFEALREYVQGDEVRHVDWAATARAGHPVVRTYRAERNQRVVVLLDTGRVVAGLVDGVPRLDHGMDATLALATVATRLGDRIGMIAFGARVQQVIAPRRDAGQLRRLSGAMHQLEPELAESGYRDAFRETLARFRRRALLVVVTELAAEAVQETLLPALPLVTREHAVVVASVRDPAVAALCAGPVHRAGDAYRAAAAIAVHAERERAAARLRGAGAVVVDALPGQLPGDLVDVYLDVKARGLL